MHSEAEKIDDSTYAIYLEVPGAQVVKLQGYFEIYEGPGTVRTLNIKKSLICILTTPKMLQDCFKILEAIRSEVPWRIAENVTEEDRESILQV